MGCPAVSWAVVRRGRAASPPRPKERPTSRVISERCSISPLCQSLPDRCSWSSLCIRRATRAISSRASAWASLACWRAARASSLARRLSCLAWRACSFQSYFIRWKCSWPPESDVGALRACSAASRISRRRSLTLPRTSSRISAASAETESRISCSSSSNSSCRAASSSRPASVSAYTLRPPSVVWVTRPSFSSLASRG